MAESPIVRVRQKRGLPPSEGSLAASELGSPVAAESQKSDASRGSSMLRWVAGSQQSVDSGFSFEGELNQQDARSVESDVQTEDKTKGKKTKKDKGTGAQATSAGKQCSITICEEIAAGTSPYCWCHKRAFGRICKMAMKGKKNRTEVYVQYCEIFGEGREKPSDPALAEQVIIDTASSMHETQEEDGAKNSGSKISTAINLGQYVHSRGTRASRDNVDSDFRLDFELFVHRLKNCRGWSEKQAEAEWLKLQAMPQVGRDNDGRHHPKYGNLRLDIPPNLIGENKVENRKGKFEERRLDTMNKSAKMDEDTKKNWLTQTDSGFDMIRLQEGLDEAMNQPLSASSLASEFDFEAAGEKILASAAALANKETGDDSKDGEGSAKKRQAGSEHPDSSPAKGPKKGDVSSTRSALWAKARDTLESGKSNVVAEMVKAAAALRQVEKDQHGQVFVAPVRQRFEICKHFTGMTEKAVGSSNADKAAPPVFEDFLYQEAEEAKRGNAQRKALGEAIAACDINPLESAALWTSVEIADFMVRVSTFTTEEQCETEGKEWEKQEHLIGQLQQTMKQVVKDLAGEIKTVAQNQKKAKKLQDKAEEDAKKAQDEAAKKTELEKAHLMSAQSFLKFTALLTPLLETVGGRLVEKPQGEGGKSGEKSKAPKEAEYDLSVPVVFPGCNDLKCLIADDAENAVSKMLAGWKAAYPKEKIYAEKQTIAALVMPLMGSSEVSAGFLTCVPESSMCTIESPGVASTLEKTKVFSEGVNYTNLDVEPSLLGTLRWQIRGATMFFLFETASLIAHFAKEEDGARKGSSLSDVRGKLLALETVEEVQAMLGAGVVGKIAQLSPGGLLYTPPGWMSAQVTVNDQEVVGVKKWLIPKQRKALEQYQAILNHLRSLKTTDGVAKAIDEVYDAVVIVLGDASLA